MQMAYTKDIHLVLKQSINQFLTGLNINTNNLNYIKMKTYNYLECVKEDVRNYIEENKIVVTSRKDLQLV